MESELQFEDIWACSAMNPRSTFEHFQNELDMILGISPLPMGLEESFTQYKIGEIGGVQIKRKTSLESESQETDLQEHQSDSSPAELQPIPGAKKSDHHNLQKHTVTALKDIVKQSQFQNLCQNQNTYKLTLKLWKQFLKIKGDSIKTKRFLSILFRSDIESVPMLKKYGFKQMFSNYTIEQIFVAKNELRRLVIIFLSNQKIDIHVDKRQIKKKEEFRLYLINFRKDLQKSVIKKRISKESSDWIVGNAKIFDCLN